MMQFIVAGARITFWTDVSFFIVWLRNYAIAKLKKKPLKQGSLLFYVE